jgi:hypothetical protein
LSTRRGTIHAGGAQNATHARVIEAPAMRRGSFRTVAFALATLSCLGAAPLARAQPAIGGTAMSGQTLASTGAVKLAGEVTRVPLATAADVASLRRKLAEVAGSRAIYLVLDDLKAAEAPAIVYEVYLGLPAGANPQPDDPHYVDTLNFFAVAPPNTQPRARSYDVTTLVNSVLSRATADADLAVTIVGRNPGGQATVPPTIGSIALIAQ